MISIVITSFNEPKTIGKCIDSFLSQQINEKYELIVSAPDLETQQIVEQYSKKNKNIKLFKDPGKGKSLALNLLLPNLKGDIIILTDGDVYVNKIAIEEILNKFRKKEVGCVSGRVLSSDSRNSLFGYWSHLLCHSAHKLREKRAKENKFLECSGYLWAFRNKVIKQFPKDVAEDTIVPILFWKKGWKVDYTEKAEVYVSFPRTLSDFVKQKKRTMASHETLNKYFKSGEIPRMKSFKNEILGSLMVLSYPKSFKEVLYTISLFPIRLYIWLLTFYKSKFKKQNYSDAWKRVESTK